MRRAIFSFLLVLGFVPALLYASEFHSSANREIVKEKTRVLEHQILTNKENEFEYTFWRVARNGVRNLERWKNLMKESNITVGIGRVEVYNEYRVVYEENESIESLIELSPDGRFIEIKSGNPFIAIIAEMQGVASTTKFFIPVGCYREL